MTPDPINAVHVVIPLAALWALLVWAGTRHARREEANRQRFANHIANIRVAPMDERWLNRREREGRE